MRTSTFIYQWGLLGGAFLVMFHLNAPTMLKFRPWDAFFLLMVGAVLIKSAFRDIRRNQLKRGVLFERILLLTLITVIVACSFEKYCRFYYWKYSVLQAPHQKLNRLGRHFIVGYSDYDKIKELVARGAVGGVYITRRNVQGKTVERIREETDYLQEIQQKLGLPPLIIAADQEGGIVSRLSPPLTRLPPLSALLEDGVSNPEILKERVVQYATVQAQGLARVGVNLNLSPVVDIKGPNASGILDFHTRINQRAFSEDKFIVADVASTYCKILNQYDIIPTLKHFPGLRMVQADTHYFVGELLCSAAVLDKNDWIPFRKVIQRTTAFIMLGHVKLIRIDSENPASFSKKIVQGIIREQWGCDGILITDDLNMGPAHGSASGIGGAAVKALNAGVDLLLISYDGDQYFPAMYAVMQADNTGELDAVMMVASDNRLQKYAVGRLFEQR